MEWNRIKAVFEQISAELNFYECAIRKYALMFTESLSTPTAKIIFVFT